MITANFIKTNTQKENDIIKPIYYSNKVNNDLKKEKNKNSKKNKCSNKKKGTDNLMKKDSCIISKEAMEMYEFALNEAKSASDVREEKVNNIKKAINSGTYNISSKDLAEKLFKDKKDD